MPSWGPVLRSTTRWVVVLESVYQECLELELAQRGIAHRPRAELTLLYKGQRLSQKYIPDFICMEKIIVEIKALTELTDAHRAQLHNYLKATGHRLGLLVNFGQYPKLDYERIVR
jgi:GxxExxY protein